MRRATHVLLVLLALVGGSSSAGAGGPLVLTPHQLDSVAAGGVMLSIQGAKELAVASVGDVVVERNNGRVVVTGGGAPPAEPPSGAGSELEQAVAAALVMADNEERQAFLSEHLHGVLSEEAYQVLVETIRMLPDQAFHGYPPEKSRPHHDQKLAAALKEFYALLSHGTSQRSIRHHTRPLWTR